MNFGKAYIAASMAALDEAQELGEHLRRNFYTIITSSWHKQPIPKPFSLVQQQAVGMRNISDLQEAQMLIILTDKPSSSGGLHFEHGYGIGTGKLIVAIGSLSFSMFLSSSHDIHASNIEEFKEYVAPRLFKDV